MNTESPVVTALDEQKTLGYTDFFTKQDKYTQSTCCVPNLTLLLLFEIKRCVSFDSRMTAALVMEGTGPTAS